MTDKEIERVAVMLERTWSSTYYKKDHKDLVSTLITLFADVSFNRVSRIINDFAAHYDNIPSVAQISREAHRGPATNTRPAQQHPAFYDDEGCYYIYDLDAKEYDCVWKYWWEGKRSKVETINKWLASHRHE